ncbi:ABC transporter ATP-binding protein [Pseudovibrio sp. Ad37]|uniref:ABC transporter ATP-binding protein n=1 Tax=Pseudovibrio sp. Ad37 TaxID=989422 RepID=UPI0007AE7006|nr:ABC transporter ATP-binding protein [Pseudovibrio sp. Ad37]KZL17081.1 sn-glycerol-3-phosphate import ATP-binding protein UgpC [Pseudovibrio sp. Ad37]
MNSISIRDLSLNFGEATVLDQLNLDVAEGEFLVLLGASGCGKSTLLNCIAGLLDLSEGQIIINGKNVTWAEPKDRGIGMVFQSYALYPQMTVRGNLTFGLKNAKVPRDDIEHRVNRAAQMLQIEPLLNRKPGQLSGGQRQRVAIGRALVRDVDVFLFDEPLSNLDAKLRAELRVELKRLHQKLRNTMIYVTHDQVEAMTLADRIAIMRDGVIQQLADPFTIYNQPVNKYVASFIGSPAMNFLDGAYGVDGQPSFTSDTLDIALGRYTFKTRAEDNRPIYLGIRPEHVWVGDAAQEQPFRSDISVEVVEPMGSDTLVWTSLGNQPFHFRMDGQATVNVGDRLPIGFDPVQASLFDKTSEIRL